ncbi:MAG: hypothetical protein AAB401_00655, partial [Acidobacteriota bacterium]
NSPMHWDDNGNLYAFASVRHPFRSAGQNLYALSPTTQRTVIQDSVGVEGGKWLEATWRDNDGMLYGWYHNEPPPMCSNDLHLSAPRIGAMLSTDEGATWQDLGIVLQAPDDSLNCQTQNYYFAGGNGDFSVMLDQNKEYFYFFFGTYHSQLDEQGVSMARMKYADRKQPVGQVRKWRNGKWDELGIGGKVTPIFPVITDWHRADASAYWGPSIHFNTYLGKYVIVRNHALDGYWNQEGIYISYADDLSNPLNWTPPERLQFEPQGMAYPQIVGIEKGGTDKLAGKSARLFMLGQSGWQITFDLASKGDGTCNECIGDTPSRIPSSPRQLPPSRQTPNRQTIRAARPSFLTDLDQVTRKKIEERRR